MHERLGQKPVMAGTDIGPAGSKSSRGTYRPFNPIFPIEPASGTHVLVNPIPNSVSDSAIVSSRQPSLQYRSEIGFVLQKTTLGMEFRNGFVFSFHEKTPHPAGTKGLPEKWLRFAKRKNGHPDHYWDSFSMANIQDDKKTGFKPITMLKPGI